MATDDVENGDPVADDRRCRAHHAELLGERGEVPVRDRPGREAALGGASRDDQRRPESVGLVDGVADQITGIGEHGEDAQAGGLAQVEFARQFRQSEPDAGSHDEVVEDLHDAFRGRRSAGGSHPGDRLSEHPGLATSH
ncbi:hypothetical protein L612_001000000280 [Rhodococcus rhodochrous J38]|nr:hypothetical protein L612_001000000280 [Rhodococcus rhodochrous J38]